MGGQGYESVKTHFNIARHIGEPDYIYPSTVISLRGVLQEDAVSQYGFVSSSISCVTDRLVDNSDDTYFV